MEEELWHGGEVEEKPKIIIKQIKALPQKMMDYKLAKNYRCNLSESPLRYSINGDISDRQDKKRK